MMNIVLFESFKVDINKTYEENVYFHKMSLRFYFFRVSSDIFINQFTHKKEEEIQTVEENPVSYLLQMSDP